MRDQFDRAPLQHSTMPNVCNADRTAAMTERDGETHIRTGALDDVADCSAKSIALCSLARALGRAAALDWLKRENESETVRKSTD